LAKESDEYYEEALGNACQGKYYMSDIYEDLLKNKEYRINDARIGPCGHTYVRQGQVWSFAMVKESGGIDLQ